MVATCRDNNQLCYLGTSDEPCPECIVVYDADSGLVAIEGDVALPVHQAEDFYSTVLITHSDMNPVR